tara:strand:- start:149 stop:349 length:201 start_codon:yes stop_codon:yes gene_type:complete
MRDVLIEDWPLLVDLKVQYYFDTQDKIIELMRVEFLGTCILSSLSDVQHDRLINWIAEEDLYRHEE